VILIFWLVVIFGVCALVAGLDELIDRRFRSRLTKQERDDMRSIW
jgi:hypothetical protein